ncbi:hypothetical protein NBRC10512_001856 [Rhodotorula toruloides]|uniref:RHTO0S19e01332g1_1 n=2 Tax=Rhodotorula toruloides TaxID=5286 RepID=A0A061BF86_RHOTO|nr:uncharacterized protein RHTO_03708 [Rhodotorula toruloides NP11]EMS20174.1 hypothetical protein RHTO_03708 [Rhodotorula toruloides NP11]CDR48638.1 RHTO0S19e01332g1_1 [Rhodotorula toruloides]
MLSTFSTIARIAQPLARCAPPVSLFSTSTTAGKAGSGVQGAGKSDRGVPRRPPHPHKRRGALVKFGHAGDVQGQKTLYRTRTRWLVNAIVNGLEVERDRLLVILRKRKIPSSTFAAWLEIVSRCDPVFALTKLDLLPSAKPDTLIGSDTTEGPIECPNWLYLTIPSFVTDLSHVPYLVAQIGSRRFNAMDEQNRSLFLSRCIQVCLELKHFVALRETVEWIAYTPADSPSTIRHTDSFEQIFDALATGHGPYHVAEGDLSLVLRPLVALLRSTMLARGIQSTRQIYNSLWSARLAPSNPDDIIGLLSEMTDAGIAPSQAILHRVMQTCIQVGEGEMAETVMLELVSQKKLSGKKLRQLLGRPSFKRTLLDDDASLKSAAASEHVKDFAEIKGALEVLLREEGEAAEDDKADEGGQKASDRRDGVASRASAVRGEDGEDLPAAPSPAEDVRQSKDRPFDASNPADSPSPSPPRVAEPAASTSAPSQPRSGVAIPRDERDEAATSFLRQSPLTFQYLRVLRDYIANGDGTFPRPPLPFFDRVSWLVFFSTVAERPDVNPDLLVAILERMHLDSAGPSRKGVYKPPRPTPGMYAIILQAYRRHGRPQDAVQVFALLEKGVLKDSNWRSNPALLDALVRAYCAFRRDDLALRLLDRYTLENEPQPRRRAPRKDEVLKAKSDDGRLRTATLNAVLYSLSRQGRFARAYAFYTQYDSKYGVRRDVATLSIMLDAARLASAHAGGGWRSPLDAVYGADVGQSPLHGGPGGWQRGSKTGDIDDKWGGVVAWRRFEKLVFEDVIEANWQDAKIRSPLEKERGVLQWLEKTLRPSQDEGAVPSDKPNAPPRDWRPFAVTLSPTPPQYPYLYPNDIVFRALIQLVGAHAHISDIPTIVAWMRHLGVVPSRLTLGLAMAHVDGDASIAPSKVADWRRWLVDWLGEEQVPSDREIAWLRRGGGRAGHPTVVG